MNQLLKTIETGEGWFSLRHKFFKDKLNAYTKFQSKGMVTLSGDLDVDIKQKGQSLAIEGELTNSLISAESLLSFSAK